MRRKWLLLFLLILIFLLGIYFYLNKTKKSCSLIIQEKNTVCGEVVFSSELSSKYLVKIEKVHISQEMLWLDLIINNKLFNNKATVLLGRVGTEEINIVDNLDNSYDFSKESVTQKLFDIDSSVIDILNSRSGHYALMNVIDSRLAFESLEDRIPFENKEREKRSLEFINNYRDNCIFKHKDKVYFTKYLKECDYLYVGSLNIFSK